MLGSRRSLSRSPLDGCGCPYLFWSLGGGAVILRLHCLSRSVMMSLSWHRRGRLICLLSLDIEIGFVLFVLFVLFVCLFGGSLLQVTFCTHLTLVTLICFVLMQYRAICQPKKVQFVVKFVKFGIKIFCFFFCFVQAIRHMFDMFPLIGSIMTVPC